jgi:hypothetical protein
MTHLFQLLSASFMIYTYIIAKATNDKMACFYLLFIPASFSEKEPSASACQMGYF